MGRTISHVRAVILAVALAGATAAAAQGLSGGTTFLKAVRDRDGGKATELLTQPGSIVVNTRDRSSGESALHIVTRGRDATWLGWLLSKGARPDIEDNDGNTPLMVAAQLGWTEGAQSLISRRASVDAVNSRGETALIIATQRRDAPMVRLLLNAGADPNKTDSVAGYSALDYARQDRRSSNLVRLLEAGAEKKEPIAGPNL